MIKGFPLLGRRADLVDLLVDIREPIHGTFSFTGTNKYALDTVGYGVFYVQEEVAVGAESGAAEVHLPNHGAKKGDLLRIHSSANEIQEFEMGILEIVDENKFKLVGVLSAPLTGGDEVSILRPVRERMTDTGASLASVESGPVAFIKNGDLTEVEVDEIEPSNTSPLPVKLYAAGEPINITAGDLNVQLSDKGANPDITRIGDGLNEWAMTDDGEGFVKDLDVLAELETLNLVDYATEATLDALNDKIGPIGQNLSAESVSVVLASDIDPVVVDTALVAGLSTEAKQDDIIAALGAIGGEDFATEVTLAELLARTPTIGQKNSANSSPVVLSTEQEAILQGIQDSVDSLATGVSDNFYQVEINDQDLLATEETSVAISEKLPESLGAKPSAESLSVTLSSNEDPVQTATLDVLRTKVIDLSATNLSNAYTEILATTPQAYKKVNIFMSSGVALYLALGVGGSEVNKMIIPPGGFPNMALDVAIPAGSRLSLRTVQTGAVSESGSVLINFLG